VQFAGQTFSPKFDSTDVLQVELPGVDASGALALFEPVGNKTDDTNPYVLELPTTQPKPKTPVEAASGTELVLGQNDAPKLEFTGEKIGDVATVIIEGKTPLRKEYDSEKKILSVYLTQEITKLPAKLTVQFRDIAGKLIATLPLEIKALRKPGTSTDKLSCLSWNWRGRSSVKITERTHEKRAKTLHCGREGCHSEAAPVG
jgi:hypothetical protein